MPNREYIEFLTDKDKLRIQFITKQGKITRFIIQYYALVDDKWKTIVRVDDCHGCPHKHTYYLHKKEYRVKLEEDKNKVFNEYKDYIKDYFRSVKENYLLSR